MVDTPSFPTIEIPDIPETRHYDSVIVLTTIPWYDPESQTWRTHTIREVNTMMAQDHPDIHSYIANYLDFRSRNNRAVFATSITFKLNDSSFHKKFKKQTVKL